MKRKQRSENSKQTGVLTNIETAEYIVYRAHEENDDQKICLKSRYRVRVLVLYPNRINSPPKSLQIGHSRHAEYYLLGTPISVYGFS